MNPWAWWEAMAVAMAAAWLSFAKRTAQRADADWRAMPR